MSAASSIVGTNVTTEWVVEENITIIKPFTNCKTAPAGAGLVYDIMRNGTSIMTTNKITIDAAGTKSRDAAQQPVLTTTDINAGDVLRWDCTQVGSTMPGAGVVGTILYKQRF